MEDTAGWDAVLDDDDFLAEDSDGFLPDDSPPSPCNPDSPESPPDSPSSFQRALNDRTSVQEPDQVSSKQSLQSSQPETLSTIDQQGHSFPPRHSSNQSQPQQSSSSDLAQLSPKAYSNVGLPRQDLAQWPGAQNSFQGQFQRPAAPPRGESFADQSKSGYKSPYDLPMDITKPRKRVQMRQAPPQSNSGVRDQRHVSSAPLPQSPFPPAGTTVEVRGPPPPSHQYTSRPNNKNISAEPVNGPKVQGQASTPSFYEELPIIAKPRPPAAQGRYTPAQTGPSAFQAPPTANTTRDHQHPQMPPPPVPTKSPASDSYFSYQLQQPERLDPYANGASQPSTPAVVPSTRYSPAPPTSQTAPPPSRYSPGPPSSQTLPPPLAPGRYSPAPPAPSHAQRTQDRGVFQPQSSPQPPSHSPPQTRYFSQPAPPVVNALPFQPRTSSSLTNNRHPPPQQIGSAGELDKGTSATPSAHGPPEHTSPRDQSIPSTGPLTPDHDLAPPRRSQTQSPGKSGPGSTMAIKSDEYVQRPASVHGPSSPTTSAKPFPSFPTQQSLNQSRESFQDVGVVPRTDQSQQIEQQRWNGSPIFQFGVGGTVLTNFPRHIPMYSAGSTMPVARPTAGAVRLRDAKDIVPLDEHVVDFPGPLRSKSKKKEVLSWLTTRIAAMENMSMQSLSERLPESIRQHDEKILLWKVVRIMVEHDGLLDGGLEVQRAVSTVLSPDSAVAEELSSMGGAVDSSAVGAYEPKSSGNKNLDPAAVESLRKSLLQGQREKAVWIAVDNRMWAHAMLISSTLDPSLGKQVAHEFVRQEVKVPGTNTESLAALYEVFAGNLEESIDELVPPSARAGLQMVSKAGGAEVTKNASEGLDKWRETLSLVLNNRSREDHIALAALGRLLASYGRTEASHICYLFANSPMRPSVFSGADDPLASIVLLGADHRGRPHQFFADPDAVLLTEIYEFASSVLPNQSKSTMMPHLQAYKLQRIRSLAVAGYKAEAHAYCEAIGVSLRSTTKLSPYYHPQFLAELEELTKRLSQTPAETSSWISKPTMGKVSGSMWNKFTTFVAGDDSDKASTGSGRDTGHEVGPFAKVSGTPAMSRSGSSSDLYGSHASSNPQFAPNTLAGSRYAPNGPHSTSSSSELTRGRASLESERSPLYVQQSSGHRSQYEPHLAFNPQGPASPPVLNQYGSPYTPLGASPPVQSYHATPPQTSYVPMPQQEGLTSGFRPGQTESSVAVPTYQPVNSYVPGLGTGAQIPGPSLGTNSTSYAGNPFSPPTESGASVVGAHSSYAPPVQYQSSYEPPSTGYNPYEPEPSPDAESEPSKLKQAMMNGEKSDVPSAASATSNISTAKLSDAATATADAFTSEADEDASASSKKSAAGDSNTLKPKASWFSLFSRKDPSSLDGDGGGQKVIRAKLGEESSFYYDKELKKWVNKKDPASMQPKAAAVPPPPKGPVGRVVSESLGVGAGTGSPSLPPPPPAAAAASNLNPSRPSSSAGAMSNVNSESRAETPGSGHLPPPAAAAPLLSSSAPPSNTNTPPPPTEANNSSNAPAARPPPPKTASTSSDIDELLGGPPGNAAAGGRQAGGTVKGRRARGGAGRYVDVMAK